jgi:hypothetical protein
MNKPPGNFADSGGAGGGEQVLPLSSAVSGEFVAPGATILKVAFTVLSDAEKRIANGAEPPPARCAGKGGIASSENPDPRIWISDTVRSDDGSGAWFQMTAVVSRLVPGATQPKSMDEGARPRTGVSGFCGYTGLARRATRRKPVAFFGHGRPFDARGG